MRIPEALPFEFAFFNALHGVPCFGVFAPFTCPPGEVAAWSLLIPWAIHALGPLAGRVILALPPTPLAVAFLLDSLGAHVLVGEQVPLSLVATLRARVAAVVPSDLPSASVEGVLAISVHPPCPDIARAIRVADRVLLPGTARVFAWREGDGLELRR